MGRSEVILLDTHAAIWFAIDEGLGAQSQNWLFVSSLKAEDGLVVGGDQLLGTRNAGRQASLRAVKSAGELRAKLLGAGIRELPLTGDIAILAGELDALHGDPADRMIVTMAIAHDATLMTADENLLKWRHRRA